MRDADDDRIALDALCHAIRIAENYALWCASKGRQDEAIGAFGVMDALQEFTAQVERAA